MGTVTIAPGAWRSALDLKGHMDAEVKNSTNKALVINSTMSLRSTLTKSDSLSLWPGVSTESVFLPERTRGSQTRPVAA